MSAEMKRALLIALWLLLAPAKDHPGEWVVLDPDAEYARRGQCEAAKWQYLTGAERWPAHAVPMTCRPEGTRMRCTGGPICEDLGSTERTIRR